MFEKVILPEQYRTGHDTVDEQHAHLFSILLGIVTTIKGEKNSTKKQMEADTSGLISELQSYTRSHFQYEERMMEKTAYPELENHRKIHEGFKAKMTELLALALNKDETTLVLLNDMAAYVKSWYMQHVLSEDKKMVEFVKANEKKPEKKS